MTPMLQSSEDLSVKYPKAKEFAEAQAKHFWTKDEVDVESDLIDVRGKFTEAETHGVTTVLGLFTQYEVKIGSEYWSNKIMKWFPRLEFQQMGAMFAATELMSHAEFYKELNTLMGLDNPEFYLSYKDKKVLADRMAFINKAVSSGNKLLSIGVFSLIEGAVLYSAFAYLKHFTMQGKNLLKGTSAGLNYSVAEENLHAEAGAWLFNELLKETLEESATFDSDSLKKIIIDTAIVIEQHEHAIIDLIFEKGEPSGITAKDCKAFATSRVDLCLQKLGIKSDVFSIESNPISDWFYSGINTIKIHDFFSSHGSEYTRDWTRQKLKWRDLDAIGW